jgi:sugar O-acyltransferase (sialic acid O-acetyltransferase NeuD family)
VKIVIIGAGGHAQVVADIVQGAPRVPGGAELVGFLDERKSLQGKIILGAPVIGPVSLLPSLSPDAAIVALADNRVREGLTCRVEAAGVRLATAVHPSAVVARDVEIRAGAMLCAGTTVNTGTTVGRGVILNTGCTVDHHTAIGDFVHIAPGVHMGGEVTVGEGAMIGIGAVVLPRIRIGKWAVVGAGAVVTRDVPDAATVVGSPARPLVRKPALQTA